MRIAEVGRRLLSGRRNLFPPARRAVRFAHLPCGSCRGSRAFLGSTPAVSSIGAYQVTSPSCSSTLRPVPGTGWFRCATWARAASGRRRAGGSRATAASSILVGCGPPGGCVSEYVCLPGAILAVIKRMAGRSAVAGVNCAAIVAGSPNRRPSHRTGRRRRRRKWLSARDGLVACRGSDERDRATIQRLTPIDAQD